MKVANCRFSRWGAYLEDEFQEGMVDLWQGYTILHCIKNLLVPNMIRYSRPNIFFFLARQDGRGAEERGWGWRQGEQSTFLSQLSCISPAFNVYFSCISHVLLCFSHIFLLYLYHAFLLYSSPAFLHSQPYPPGQLPRPNSLNDFNEVEEEV